jgi:hypothetical protein
MRYGAAGSVNGGERMWNFEAAELGRAGPPSTRSKMKAAIMEHKFLPASCVAPSAHRAEKRGLRIVERDRRKGEIAAFFRRKAGPGRRVPPDYDHRPVRAQ